MYAPAVPGVTSPPAASRSNAPSIQSALEETDPKKRAGALLELARDWFDASKWYHREAIHATAFYFGWQYGYYSETGDRYISNPQPRSSSMVRIVVNVVKPTVDQATGILTRDDPIFGAAAAKTDIADVASGEAADNLTRDIWRAHRLRDMYRNSARDSFVTGTQPIMVEWDDTGGAFVHEQAFNPETGAMEPKFSLVTGEPGVEGEGPNFSLKPRYKKQGDLRFTYLDRAQVAPDPCAKTDVDGEGLFVVERWSYARLREAYPTAMAEVQREPDVARDERRLGTQADRSSPIGSGGTISEGAARLPDQVDVYRLYVRSCREYPRGKEIRFCQGVILLDRDNPMYPAENEIDESWPRSPWPVFAARCDQRGTTYWGAGKVVQMIDPQKAFNGTFSKTIQHVASIANTKILLPKGLDVEMSDEIGQVIRFARTIDASKIGYLTPPDLPQAYTSVLSLLKSELEYIAGINEATMGETPSANSSGRQVSLLQNANIGKLKPMKDSLDDTWAEIMRCALFFFRRHAEQKRKVLILGQGKVAQIKYLDRADIAAGTDITVFNDRSLPSDPTQKILALQQVTTMLQGVEDPRWKKALLKLLRLHDFNGYLEELDLDEVKAEYVVRKLDLGEPWFRHESDDPISMVIAIEGFIKSAAFAERVAAEQASGAPSNLLGRTQAAWTYYKTLATAQPGTPRAVPQPAGFVSPEPAAPPPMAAQPGMAPPAPGTPPVTPAVPPSATAPEPFDLSGQFGPFAPATAPDAFAMTGA